MKKRTDIYIFLAKHAALRSGEITKLTKIDKAEVYRVLTNLQTKGLVEKTLEAPTRFSATPFEKAIDSFIKFKRDEANRVEKTKNELIKDWNHITKAVQHSPIEKFVVIEGWRKIYPRISQMLRETKYGFSSVSSVSGYMRAEQLGIFDEMIGHPLKNKISFRFISEISNQNMVVMEKLLDRVPKNLGNIRGRNSDFGFNLSPRMVIRDDEEILLFINPLGHEALNEKDDVGLWTNCRTIVQSFASMFEDLWRNSTDIGKIAEEGTNFPTEIQPFGDIKLQTKKYFNSIQAANKEIVIMTSAEGLNDCLESIAVFEEASQRGVAIKIMAPLIKDNFEAAKKLSNFCEIRHIHMSFSEIAVIDEKILFQFKGLNNLGKSGFSLDKDYIAKIRNNLDAIWKKSTKLSEGTLESVIGPFGFRPSTMINKSRSLDNIRFIDENEKITEKEIVEKIFKAKRIPLKDPYKDIHMMYASGGTAIVHPPENFNLPDLLFDINHIDKHSGLGQGDAMIVYLWLQTPKGYAFVPAGGFGDNSNGVAFRKREYAGFPAEENYRLVKKDVLQVHVHGNTLFVGWTEPILLLPPRYVLPPATLLIEGYGEVKTRSFTSIMFSGFRNKTEINGLDAFVTFMHPASNYSGPGTDGFFYQRSCYDNIGTAKSRQL